MSSSNGSAGQDGGFDVSLFERMTPDDHVRLWVAACSAIASMLLEAETSVSQPFTRDRMEEILERLQSDFFSQYDGDPSIAEQQAASMMRVVPALMALFRLIGERMESQGNS